MNLPYSDQSTLPPRRSSNLLLIFILGFALCIAVFVLIFTYYVGSEEQKQAYQRALLAPESLQTSLDSSSDWSFDHIELVLFNIKGNPIEEKPLSIAQYTAFWQSVKDAPIETTVARRENPELDIPPIAKLVCYGTLNNGKKIVVQEVEFLEANLFRMRSILSSDSHHWIYVHKVDVGSLEFFLESIHE